MAAISALTSSKQPPKHRRRLPYRGSGLPVRHPSVPRSAGPGFIARLVAFFKSLFGGGEESENKRASKARDKDQHGRKGQFSRDHHRKRSSKDDESSPRKAAGDHSDGPRKKKKKKKRARVQDDSNQQDTSRQPDKAAKDNTGKESPGDGQEPQKAAQRSAAAAAGKKRRARNNNDSTSGNDSNQRSGDQADTQPSQPTGQKADENKSSGQSSQPPKVSRPPRRGDRPKANRLRPKPARLKAHKPSRKMRLHRRHHLIRNGRPDLSHQPRILRQTRPPDPNRNASRLPLRLRSLETSRPAVRKSHRRSRVMTASIV